jgi:protoporphyrin/coproporphyrin ferrochelatase
MRFIDTTNFDHSRGDKTGVLISNLGTPTAPSKKAVRSYLKEFLWDPRVVEIPRPLWWLILNGIILNTRPARSAAAYQKIWMDNGSPLQVHTAAQAEALKVRLKESWGDGIVVDYAMRYGEPSIDSVIQNMLDQGVTRLLVLPLYPQHSCATTSSTFDAVIANLGRRRWIPDLRFVSSYHDDPGYIRALADSIREFRKQHGDSEKLVFSYHGEPKRYLDRGDPYHCQCLKTSRLVAEALGLEEEDYLSTFQSRFGKAEWLQPYTDATLKTLATGSTSSVQVICPGFSADCLETLEEIAMENRDVFLQAGGATYQYIPCLNSSENHITALAELATRHLSGWEKAPEDVEARAARALEAGAKR